MKTIVNEETVPVKGLIQGVESGDAASEAILWNEFYEKLLRYLESRIRRRGIPTGLIDEEAVTASVLESVFKCAKQGRLENVQNWAELSQLLFAMTNRKFVDHWRRATAQRVFPGMPPGSLSADGMAVPNAEIPEISLIYEEQLSRLMDLLPDELHRQIAVLKLADYTLAEISSEVNRAIPTVHRKWRCIRGIWADEIQRWT
jgi:DNA-directed RNA polymerase specialized sigma24 family protein